MRPILLAIGLLAVAGVAGATCPPSCAIPGGGSPRSDCHAEFAGPLRLNWPPFDPSRPKAAKEVRCFDGDPGCDLDGVVNQECRFPVDVCLRNPDPAFAGCTPGDVMGAAVLGPGADPDLQALRAAVNALLPATTNVCTSGQSLRVPLRGPDGKGRFRMGVKSVRVKATTAAGTDPDRLKLRCVPRGWTSHGYDHRNRRATAVESTLSAANAALLVPKWTLDLEALEGGGPNGVTSTPTVQDGVAYVTSWNGKVYAVKEPGVVLWSFDTGSVGQLGVQSSATLTADGRLLVGDSLGRVYCLLAKTGQLLWTATVGDTDPLHAHVWGSPTVANGRVFVGRASHNDVPCTRGHLYAFDLDTGAELWRYATVPANICQVDTGITCTTAADCPSGPCVPGVGAGVTATVATDPSGQTVYVATVGCFTSPSIGKSESLISLDAATGAEHWSYRTRPPEQFVGFPFHDYGFLNGPVLVDADDGLGGTRPLLVAGSKDGSLFALDPASGAPVWTTTLAGPPTFAGFGLFNGAIGFADHRFVAALNTFGSAGWPSTNDHLYAFGDTAGGVLWSDQIGESWGSMALANGLAFMGTLGAPELYVYETASGTRLATLPLPDTSTSGAAILDGRVYVGYGISGSPGGMRVFGLP